jgi:hypothetical protein
MIEVLDMDENGISKEKIGRTNQKKFRPMVP